MGTTGNSNCRADGDDVFFVNINHGPNDGDVGAGQIGAGRKGVHPSFKNQAHQKGFQRVVQVMAQGYFVAAQSFGNVIDCTAAHVGAQRAGIGLLAFFVEQYGQYWFAPDERERPAADSIVR